MLDEQLLQQLNHPDAERRKQAITALAKTKDRAALRHLAAVFKSDADPDVRELARKAGLYIQKHNAATAVVPAPVSVYDSAVEADESEAAETYMPLPSKRKSVTDSDQRRAQSLVEQAADLHMRGEDGKAADLLNRAINLNPELMDNNYARGLAASITGLPADDAVHHLLVSAREKQEKGKRGQSSGDATWGSALIDLLIYGVAVGGMTFLALLVALQLVIVPVRMMGNSYTGEDAVMFAEMSRMLMTAGPPTILLVSVVTAIFAVIALLIQYGAIHFAATRILEGRGSFTLLIRKLTLFLTFTYPISYAGSFVGLLVMIANPDLANLVSAATIVFTLGLMVFFSYRVGQVYEFGTFKGCGAIIISAILLAVASVAIGCLLSFVLTASLINTVPPSALR